MTTQLAENQSEDTQAEHDQQRETEQKCSQGPGNYGLCMNSAFQQRVQCHVWKQQALSDLTTIQNSMVAMHATAQQVVDADISGIAEWHPITGPYWALYNNPISYEAASNIVAWAVKVADSVKPSHFAHEVFVRCLTQRQRDGR